MIGNESDSVNMLLIGANEVWFQVVSREPQQRCDRMERIICASRHVLNTFKTTQPQHDYEKQAVRKQIESTSDRWSSVFKK